MTEFTYFPIEEHRDFFIFGESIETPYGLAKFISYKNFNIYTTDLAIVTQNSLHIFYMYYNYYKDNRLLTPEVEEELEIIKKMPLRVFVMNSEMFVNSYLRVFSLVFSDGLPLSEEFIDVIFASDDSFMDARKIVMEMNLLKEEEVIDNPEIQYFLNKKKEITKKDSLKPSDYLTSISVYSGISLYELAKYSAFMVFSSFSRIAQMKNYDTTTLFSTVSDKVSIEEWSKHLDLFENEASGMNREQLNNYRNMLS